MLPVLATRSISLYTITTNTTLSKSVKKKKVNQIKIHYFRNGKFQQQKSTSKTVFLLDAKPEMMGNCVQLTIQFKSLGKSYFYLGQMCVCVLPCENIKSKQWGKKHTLDSPGWIDGSNVNTKPLLNLNHVDTKGKAHFEFITKITFAFDSMRRGYLGNARVASSQVRGRRCKTERSLN